MRLGLCGSLGGLGRGVGGGGGVEVVAVVVVIEGGGDVSAVEVVADAAVGVVVVVDAVGETVFFRFFCFFRFFVRVEDCFPSTMKSRQVTMSSLNILRGIDILDIQYK